MTLTEYAQSKPLTHDQIADGINRSRGAVTRYANGTRIPDKETMVRLFHFTGGLVTPNDFYGIGERPTSGTASAAIPPFEDVEEGAAA